jgi:hypothetical protein
MAALIIELVIVTLNTDIAPIAVIIHLYPAFHVWGYSISTAVSNPSTPSASWEASPGSQSRI